MNLYQCSQFLENFHNQILYQSISWFVNFYYTGSIGGTSTSGSASVFGGATSISVSKSPFSIASITAQDSPKTTTSATSVFGGGSAGGGSSIFGGSSASSTPSTFGGFGGKT